MIRLKQLRLDAGLTRQDLAQQADVSLQTIINLETGTTTDPHVRTLQKLAEVLRARPSELLLPAQFPDPDLGAAAA